jgi:hypothetical protein
MQECSMSERDESKEDDEAKLYEICIKGHLDAKWAVWFEGLTVTLQANGDTTLTGEVVDQAALYGLLRKVRDLGLPLLSVIQINGKQTNTD